MKTLNNDGTKVPLFRSPRQSTGSRLITPRGDIAAIEGQDRSISRLPSRFYSAIARARGDWLLLLYDDFRPTDPPDYTPTELFRCSPLRLKLDYRITSPLFRFLAAPEVTIRVDRENRGIRVRFETFQGRILQF